MNIRTLGLIVMMTAATLESPRSFHFEESSWELWRAKGIECLRADLRQSTDEKKELEHRIEELEGQFGFKSGVGVGMTLMASIVLLVAKSAGR